MKVLLLSQPEMLFNWVNKQSTSSHFKAKYFFLYSSGYSGFLMNSILTQCFHIPMPSLFIHSMAQTSHHATPFDHTHTCYSQYSTRNKALLAFMFEMAHSAYPVVVHFDFRNKIPNSGHTAEHHHGIRDTNSILNIHNIHIPTYIQRDILVLTTQNFQKIQKFQRKTYF